LRTLGAVVLVVAFITVVEDSILAPLVPAAVATATPANTQPVSLAGTLMYYPNNVGKEIPYLVYQGASGTAMKSLTFSAGSTCEASNGVYPCATIASALGAYFGAGAVTVKGTVEDENLAVSSMESS
jgi:hypothetical protein